MPSQKPIEIDVAAGGLLEATENGALKIAVIHRPRHDDWTIPKGHLEQGETIKEAAIREMEEETGCVGEIVEILRPVAYLVNGHPKIVVMYRMKLIRKGEFTPGEEVSEVAWMTPAESLSALTYETDRNLVSGAYTL